MWPNQRRQPLCGGKKSRARTDRADARHLRQLLVDHRVPESWIPPAEVLDARVLVCLYKDFCTFCPATVPRLQGRHNAAPTRRSGMQRDGGITDHSGALGSPSEPHPNRALAVVWTLRLGCRGSDLDVRVPSTVLKKSRRACATWSGASRAA